MIRFKILSFLLVSCGITAIIMYTIAVKQWFNEIYIKYHSLWHCFVFLTSGFGALLKYNLDEQLYPMVNRRDTLDSL